MAINSTNSESEITLGLLKAINEDEQLTQRSIASDLGIALGLVNMYLKRCAKKGLIKIRQVPRNRYAYYLTPQGFAEKSRLTAEFLSQSLSLFRQSRMQYREILSRCAENDWNKVAFYGASDLCEIAVLCAQEFPIEILAVIQASGHDAFTSHLRTVSTVEDAGEIDALIITDLDDPQNSFDFLVGIFQEGRILTPPFLEITRTQLVLEDCDKA